MPLSREELKRRINAAAALNGWKMNDLPDKLEAFGAQKHLAAGLADGRLEPRPAALSTLAGFFNVPVMWFTSEDWTSLVNGETNYAAGVKEGLKRQQRQIDMLGETLTHIAAIERRLARLEGGQEAAEALGLGAVEDDAALQREARTERSSEPRVEGGNG